MFGRVLRRNSRGRRISSVALELSLTFIGVLAALGVENLRESFAEDRREKEYLTAFRGALQADTATINQELQRAFFKLNAAGKFIELINRDDSVSNEEFGQAIEAVLMLIDPAYNTAVYEDLKATGNSRIIQNIPLRNDIISHYVNLNKLIMLQQNSIQFISYNQIFTDQFRYDEFIQFDRMSSRDIIDRFRKNGEIQLYLSRLQKAMIFYRNSLIYSALPRTLILLEKIDLELQGNR